MILGLALTVGLTNELREFLEIVERPYWIEFGVETPVVLFTVAVTLIASVAAGIVPAIKASGVDVQQTLKDGSGGSLSLGMARFSTVLVVTHRIQDAEALGGQLIVMMAGAVEDAGDAATMIAGNATDKARDFLAGREANP